MRRKAVLPIALAASVLASGTFADDAFAQTPGVDPDAGAPAAADPDAGANANANANANPGAGAGANAGAGAGANPNANPGAGAPAAVMLVAVVDAAPIGVDPAAATFVTDVMRRALADLGYTAVPTPQLYDAARRLQLPFPVHTEGLEALARTLSAPVAVTAEVRASAGYYQVLVRLRFANEPAERTRQIVATQWTLGDSVRASVQQLVAGVGPAPAQIGDSFPPALPDMSAVPAVPRLRPFRVHPQPWELAVGLEFAIGPGQDAFVNVLGYGRAAYFVSDRFGLTGSLSLGNFRGRAARVWNVLAMIGVETAVDVLPRQHVYLPLRAEVGYLPFNGPVLRGTAGIAFGVGRTVRVELDILTPTVWFLPGATAVSLDLGAQVIFGVGSPPRRRRRARPAASEDGAAQGANNGAAQPQGAARGDND